MGCGRMYQYGVSGEVSWLVGKGCGERNGGGVGKCIRVWGPNTLPPTLPISSSPHSPHLSLHLPYLPHIPTHFPTPPLYLFPHLPFLLHTPTHFLTIPTYLPSSFQSVAKLPCDEVSEAKLLCGEVTGNQAVSSGSDKQLTNSCRAKSVALASTALVVQCLYLWTTSSELQAERSGTGIAFFGFS